MRHEIVGKVATVELKDKSFVEGKVVVFSDTGITLSPTEVAIEHDLLSDVEFCFLPWGSVNFVSWGPDPVSDKVFIPN